MSVPDLSAFLPPAVVEAVTGCVEALDEPGRARLSRALDAVIEDVAVEQREQVGGDRHRVRRGAVTPPRTRRWPAAPAGQRSPAAQLCDVIVSDGVPANVVSRLMGPRRVRTTLDRFPHDARDYADLRVRQVFTRLAADDLPMREAE